MAFSIALRRPEVLSSAVSTRISSSISSLFSLSDLQALRADRRRCDALGDNVARCWRTTSTPRAAAMSMISASRGDCEPDCEPRCEPAFREPPRELLPRELSSIHPPSRASGSRFGDTPKCAPISRTESWPARYSRSIASQSTLLRSVMRARLSGNDTSDKFAEAGLSSPTMTHDAVVTHISYIIPYVCARANTTHMGKCVMVRHASWSSRRGHRPAPYCP